MIYITDIEEYYTEAEFTEMLTNAQKQGFYLGFAAGAKNSNVKSLDEIDKIMNRVMSEIMIKSSEYIDFEEII
jgi:hypothetical protein